MIRVGVVGARGRMGTSVCAAVADADDLELVAAIDRTDVGVAVPAGPRVHVVGSLDALVDAGADVAIDFTHPDVVMETVRWCIDRGIHLVVGTTGIGLDDLKEIRGLLRDDGANVVVASNFAIGAVLMMRFAAQAARWFPAVEIIELHHDRKADAPSGTALATARRIVEGRSEPYRGPLPATLEGVRGGDVDGVRVHSVRLPGLLAHQEVLFGGQGQTLSIRHDSTDRSSFMPGVLLAVRSVADRPGLTVGLEPLLDLPSLP